MMRFSHLTLAMLATLAVAPAAFAQDTGTTESASGKRFANMDQLSPPADSAVTPLSA